MRQCRAVLPRLFASLLLVLGGPLHAQIQLQGPAETSIDSRIEVSASGAVPERSFFSVVAPDTPEGRYERYSYYQPGAVELAVPAEPGEFELRLLGPDSPYPTLARRPITLVMPEVQIDAPDQVAIGAAVSIRWQGPSKAREYLTIVPADAAEGSYERYAYTEGEGNGELSLEAPSQPGPYEIRYLSGSQNRTLGKRALTVGDVAMGLEFAPSAAAGSQLSVRWTGPGNPRDYVTVVPADAPINKYESYAYTVDNPVSLRLPEAAGDYQVRYVTADASRILVSKPIAVGGVSATLKAPAEVKAGGEFLVEFSGPDNDGDYLAVTATDDAKRYLTYSYTRRGSPLPLRAPEQPGDYALHYLTAREDRSLAAQSIRVVPGDAAGSLRVLAGGADSAAQTTGDGAPAIALILDASGSMLQRLGSERRIELARAALDRLVAKGLPEDARVALRVFGHRKPDACDTELLRPLAALDRAEMRAQISGIEARNLAKTPIADSLRAVAADLDGVEGRAIVVLVTDGEETCGGDPAAEIAQLNQQGFKLVLNVVGFAVDEHALEREFARWAELGGGAYFSARDGDALAEGISQAVRLPFVVYRGSARLGAGFVGGEPLALPVGRYEVDIAGQRQAVEIRKDEVTELRADQ